MNELNRNRQIIRFLLGLLGVLLLGWIFWQIRQVVIYFAVATVLALMGRPLMKLLDRIRIKNWRMPVWLSALTVLVTFIFVTVLIFQFLIPVLVDQIQIIASIDVDSLMGAFDEQITAIERTLYKMNITDVNRESIEKKISENLDFSMLGDVVTSMLNGLGSLLIAVMSILFITFFLLKDQGIVNNIIDSMTPDRYLEKVHSIITDTRKLLSRYFLGVALQVSIIATIIGVGLSIVGVPNAILIGILAGVFNIIPYLGPIIGGVLGLTLSVLSNVHAEVDANMLPLILEVLAVFATAQLTDNFVLQPLIFSKSVKAHPLEIFVVIMSAGMISGVIGMILAVPTYTFLRIVAREFFQGYKVVQGLTKDL
ncbi:MAG: AI-2E family transporter [Flavobacteriales bacterium]|nr:AI-2E family transporter [Bacteroidota bacterium]MCB9241008.1 AI-2E family transporter [Flavobacteriales bacterium]